MRGLNTSGPRLAAWLFLCACGSSGCATTIEKFNQSIAPGYKPLDKAFATGQRRPGFMKSDTEDFEFEPALIGTLERRTLAEKPRSRTYSKQEIKKFAAPLRDFIIAGLSANRMKHIDVKADDAKVTYYDAGYAFYRTDEPEDWVKKAEVVTEVVEAGKLEIVYEYEAVSEAQFRFEIAQASASLAEAHVGAVYQSSFSVVFPDRAVAYTTRPLPSRSIKKLENGVILFGRVNREGRPAPGVRIVVATDGMPFYSVTDPYGRYAVPIRKASTVHKITAELSSDEKPEREFDARLDRQEYNFP